jgi:hypothetical protein
MPKINFNSIQIQTLTTAFQGSKSSHDLGNKTIIAANRLNSIPTANRDSMITLDEVTSPAKLEPKAAGFSPRDAYRLDQVPLLTPTEEDGAVNLIDIMGNADVQAAPAVTYAPSVTLPARASSMTLSEAKAALTKAGVADANGNATSIMFKPMVLGKGDRQAHGYARAYSTVNLFSVIDRLAQTRLSTDVNSDGNTLTPDMLKSRAIDGDPYASDGTYPLTNKLLTDDERAGAELIYATLFVPKPQIEAPTPITTQLAQVGDSQASNVMTATLNSLGTTVVAQDTITAKLQHQTVTFTGTPGAVILLANTNGSPSSPSGDLNASLNTAYTIPSSGSVSIPANGQLLAGTVLLDPDGTGLLSPRVVGTFAVSLPKDQASPVTAV